MDERDQSRKDDPSHPRLDELNTDINNKTKIHQQEKWLKLLDLTIVDQEPKSSGMQLIS